MVSPFVLQDKPLPSGWKWVRLGDVCHQDRVAVAPSDLSGHAFPYIGGENIESQTGRILPSSVGIAGQPSVLSNTFRFDARHVLYSKLRPYLNKVAMPDFRGRCSTELIPLLPVGIDRTFLGLFLRLPETANHATQTATGSRMPRTDMDALMKLPVPFPPLREQERIVANLERQMKTVRNAWKAAEERLDVASLLPEALLRSFVPLNGESLPLGWKSSILSEVCRVVTGNTPSKSNPEFYGGDIPWVNPSHLGLSKYVEDSEEHLTTKGAQSARMVPLGTVMIACISGSRANIGKASIAKRPLTTNQQINSLVAGPEIDSEFLYYYMLSVKSLLQGMASSTNQNIINKSKLSEVAIKYPSLDTQRKIAAELTDKFELAESVQQSARVCLTGLSDLSSILLRRAFAGEIK